MRILHVTDFHFRKRWYAWLSEAALGYDLMCFTGNFLEMFAGHALTLRTQAEWVEDWLRQFPKPLIGCLGNHDRVLRGPGGVVMILSYGEATSSGDQNFLCWPWNYSAALPEAPLIVLAHTPPCGVFVAQSEEDGDIGDVKLSAEITRLRRGSLVLSGHEGRKAGGSTRRRIARLLRLFDELCEEIAPPLGRWLRGPNRPSTADRPCNSWLRGRSSGFGR